LILARDNVKYNVKQGRLPEQALNQISFVKADVLSPYFDVQELSEEYSKWDIVISNPPYISEIGFSKDTERSVRKWEPKLALVPPSTQDEESTHLHSEDIFYCKILKAAKAGGSPIVLMEVGDLQQASRVVQIALNMKIWSLIEIWRDWPSQQSDACNEPEEIVIGKQKIRIRGSGHGRSVLCRR
jgi:methylase of polypeptide subunit release factors